MVPFFILSYLYPKLSLSYREHLKGQTQRTAAENTEKLCVPASTVCFASSAQPMVQTDTPYAVKGTPEGLLTEFTAVLERLSQELCNNNRPIYRCEPLELTSLEA